MVLNDNVGGLGDDADMNRNDSKTWFETSGILPVSRSEARPAWEKRYHFKLLITDTLIIIFVIFTAHILRYGTRMANFDFSSTLRLQHQNTYTIISLLLIVGWLLVMTVGDTRDTKIFGSGPTEYKRVVNSTLLVFGTYGVASFLLKAELGRGYILIALPLGLFLLVFSRWFWRKRLHSRRSKGFNTYRTLIVGQSEQAAHVAIEISRSKVSGFLPVGAITETRDGSLRGTEVPVLGGFDQVIRAVEVSKADTVVITNTDSVSPDELRRLGWDLEAKGVQLVVAASLTDIAGPRIHMRPVSGLPLIHVDYPQFVGRKKFMKRTLDIFGSVFGLILFSPIFLAVGIAVRSTSPGPIFYFQERIGEHGNPFRMYKFRSMIDGADDQLASLLDQQGTSDTPLHKLHEDPRITKVGGFIRKYSLDELPQFVNVFLGSMSLVGPRPQRSSEVELYSKYEHRRLMVKPGITGLWQVSGRSDLDWEDSIRLDLYYVENWSVMTDVVLLGRTVKTVIRPDGAY